MFSDANILFVTGMGFQTYSMSFPEDFQANRPFLFALKDASQILFLGKLKEF